MVTKPAWAITALRLLHGDVYRPGGVSILYAFASPRMLDRSGQTAAREANVEMPRVWRCVGLPRICTEHTTPLARVRHELTTKRCFVTTDFFERREVRSSWKDCTKVENESIIGSLAMETTLRARPNSTRLGRLNCIRTRLSLLRLNRSHIREPMEVR